MASERKALLLHRSISLYSMQQEERLGFQTGEYPC
jgi:hypothetical protein